MAGGLTSEEVRTFRDTGSNGGETGGGQKEGCSWEGKALQEVCGGFGTTGMEDSTCGFGVEIISDTVGAGGCHGGDAGGADRSGGDSLGGMGSEGGAGGANS